MIARISSVVVAFMILASAASAAPRDEAEKLAAAVAPFIDEQTVAVGHVDLALVDFGPISERLKAAIDGPALPEADRAAAKQDIEGAMTVAKGWLGAIRMAGGRDLFIVISMTDLPNSPPFIVARMNAGGDAEAIAKLLPDGERAGHHVVQGDLVITGEPKTLERLKALKPASREALAAGFEVAMAGGSAAQLVYAPSDDFRRALAETLPSLPPILGGAPLMPLAKEVKWAALGLTIAPAPGIVLTLQSPDAPAAQTVGAWITKFQEALKKMADESLKGAPPEIQKMVGDTDALVKLLTPKVAGDRVTIAIDVDAARVIGLLAPAMARARQQARSVQSMSNMRQVLLGCIAYADAHQGQFPADLNEIVKSQFIPPEFLRNPRLPEKAVGYIYVKPANPRQKSEYQVILYEDVPPTEPLINAGFADGHVSLSDRATFNDLLTKSMNRNAAKQ